MVLRVVLDDLDKSSSDDLLLKNCLEKKPICSHVFHTVFNFRFYSFGLVADVEKAFHETQIDTENWPC